MLDNHTLYIFYFDLRFLKKEANMVVTSEFESAIPAMSRRKIILCRNVYKDSELF
jgi:hypothetical protein